MLRIAIVEDDLVCADQLKGYVDRFCNENQVQAEVTRFADGAQIVGDYRPVWDLILMDIEMPHLNGMQAAHYIRQTDPSVVLIFITNMARYAIKGYEVDALDFILKPVKYAPFSLKLRKALNIIKSRRRSYLMIDVDGESLRVATDEILYIDVINHRLHIHTVQREYVTWGSMQDMETRLLGLPFVRCSHSYIVNLRNVTGIRKDTVLVSGHELPVSRPKRKEFLRQFSDYVGGGFR